MANTNGLNIENKKKYTLIRLPNPITKENIFQIENRIETRITNNNRQIALDLSNTQNIYSILITLILHIERQVTQSGGIMYLVNVTKKCQSQLKAMNLDKVFYIFESENDLSQIFH